MTETDTTVLIIEDDTQIRSFMVYALQKERYHVIAAGKGAEGLELVRQEKADILLLDLGLPDLDGIDVIRQVRQKSEMPVIVVSARDQDEEKVEALDQGADDYLTKPFSVTELMARIRVSVRHMSKKKFMADRDVFQVGKLKIDYEKRMVYLDSQYVHLTPMEYEMLVLMSRNAGKIMTTSNIIKALWNTNYVEDTRSLRTLMAGLRRKLEDVPAKPKYIVTEVGIGYRMVDELAEY